MAEARSGERNALGMPHHDPHVAPGPGDRNPGLDGVRGVAILLVLLRHSVLFGDFVPASALDGYFNAAAKASWVGVDLFFVLSGFLITGILFDTRSDRHYFRTFYMRRVLRIVPLYYAFLALYFVSGLLLVPLSDGWKLRPNALAWAASYLSNFPTGFTAWEVLPHPLRHVWSLAIEEQFYLLWPLLVWKAPRRSLMTLCVALAVLAWGVRAILLATGYPIDGYPVAGYVWTPTRLGPLALGGFVALAARDVGDLRILRRFAPGAVATMAAVVVGILLVRRDLDYLDPVTQLVGFDALAVLFAGLIVLVLTARPSSLFARCWRVSLLRSLGRYSYAMYMFHQPLLLGFAGVGLSASMLPPLLGSRWPGAVVFFLLGTAASTILAFISWHVWEQPFLRLKERFAYRATGHGATVA